MNLHTPRGRTDYALPDAKTLALGFLFVLPSLGTSHAGSISERTLIDDPIAAAEKEFLVLFDQQVDWNKCRPETATIQPNYNWHLYNVCRAVLTDENIACTDSRARSFGGFQPSMEKQCVRKVQRIRGVNDFFSPHLSKAARCRKLLSIFPQANAPLFLRACASFLTTRGKSSLAEMMEASGTPHPSSLELETQYAEMSGNVPFCLPSPEAPFRDALCIEISSLYRARSQGLGRDGCAGPICLVLMGESPRVCDAYVLGSGACPEQPPTDKSFWAKIRRADESIAHAMATGVSSSALKRDRNRIKVLRLLYQEYFPSKY